MDIPDDEIGKCKFAIGRKNKSIVKCNSTCYGNYCEYHIKKYPYMIEEFKIYPGYKRCKFITKEHRKRCVKYSKNDYCSQHSTYLHKIRRSVLNHDSVFEIYQNITLKIR